MDKEQILELYLNEIFLGQNSYGVTAAAQTYFNKTLGQLAPHEAAFSVSLPAPSDFHPARRKDVCCSGAITFCARWAKGDLPEDQYLAERDMPLLSVQNGDFEALRRLCRCGIICR